MTAADIAAARASLLDEAQDANAGLVRMLAGRDEAISLGDFRRAFAAIQPTQGETI